MSSRSGFASITFVAAVSCVGLVLAQGCERSPRLGWQEPDLLLAQAQFKDEAGSDGKKRQVPGAARLLMVYATPQGWRSRVLEDPESNVFHKAIFFQPLQGSSGILTIGANAAVLKLWRPRGSEWAAETLWRATFGGKQDRLRDMEVGDVTGDGIADVVIATHDQGVVEVLEQTKEGFAPHELSRKARTFVHEIELGDVDGDGKLEIFATPSAPNKLDGSIQPGQIEMFEQRAPGSFESRIVEEFPTRHVKEILVYDLEGSGRPTLFASLEGEEIGKGKAGSNSMIRAYRFSDGGVSGQDVIPLPGSLCRFLTGGDVDGDGKNELVASTFASGIWLIRHTKDGWTKQLIDDQSSAFEHATLIFDLDGDGKKEIYVAADDQNLLRRYDWQGDGRFKRTDLLELGGGGRITFNMEPYRPFIRQRAGSP